MSTAAELPSDGGELRLRQAREPANTPPASKPEHAASEGNLALDGEHADNVKSKKTFGRTPDGTGTPAGSHVQWHAPPRLSV